MYVRMYDYAGPALEFPPFLPLEIFDDSEYDQRLPEEWIALGYEEEGGKETRKLVPAKALLPSLASLVGEAAAGDTKSPLPPAGAPPPSFRTSRAGRQLTCIHHTFDQIATYVYLYIQYST